MGATLETLKSNGQKMAIIQRNKALDDYYLNPKICLECHKVIKVKDGEKVSQVRKKFFCNHTCSGMFYGRKTKKPKIKKAVRVCLDLLTKKNFFHAESIINQRDLRYEEMQKGN